MITEPTSNNRVMHYGLVRFVLEITFPTWSEVRCWPTLHFFQFLLSRANFDSGINAIRGKWSGTPKIPFFKNSFLNLGYTSGKVIKTLSSWLSTENLDMSAWAVHMKAMQIEYQKMWDSGPESSNQHREGQQWVWRQLFAISLDHQHHFVARLMVMRVYHQKRQSAFVHGRFEVVANPKLVW